MLDISERILQIIPVTADLFALERTDKGEPAVARIVCLALTEDAHGNQSILPMAIDSRGYICPTGSAEIIDHETECIDAEVTEHYRVRH